MLPLIEANRDRLADVCRRHGVRRLELVGSAARETDFDVERSDLDLLVEFDPARNGLTLDDFFALRRDLETVFGRRVDLSMLAAVQNPFVRAELEKQRRPLYAA